MSTQVLLADDDVELSAMLKEYLEREGFAVTAVHDGDAAARLAPGVAYQIVGRDGMLPKLDGVEALGRPMARFDRSVDVHLSSVRQKLGRGSALIHTVRGIGYHLAKG